MTLSIAIGQASVPDHFSSDVDKYIKTTMEADKVPGLALAVIRDGKVIKTGAYGLANLNFDVPVKLDTRFLLASITKQFTAAGIMVLVQDGKVKLCDPISAYLPNTAEAWKGITVRNLLTHTAGLKDRFESTNFADWLLTYSTPKMYEAAKKTPLDFAPGKAWQYSDQGFFLLGMIIEKASGKSYNTFVHERLFQPLGMNDTTMVNQALIQKNLASGYRMVGEKMYNNRRTTEYGVGSHFGMISSIGDLVKWDAALYTNTPLSDESKNLMWTASRLDDGSSVTAPNGSYGFGWFLTTDFGHRVVEHSGSTGTSFYRLPDDRTTVIILTNLDLYNAPGIAADVAAMLVPDLRWGSHKALPDPDPAFGEKFKAELLRMSSGVIDPSLYTEEAARQTAPIVKAQKPVFDSVGPLSKLEYLATDVVGNLKTLRYRATYKDAVLGYSVVVTKDGKIGNLTGRPVEAS